MVKYIETFENYCQLISKKFPNPENHKILDLGTGTGTHAIVLATLGFQVVTIDASSQTKKIIDERCRYWSNRLNKKIKVKFFCSDALFFDYSKLGKIDSLISVFAFNMMQPSEKLLSLIAPNFAKNCVVFIQDGNQSALFNRCMPGRRRDCLEPKKLAKKFQKLGFEIEVSGNCALPPFAFSGDNKFILMFNKVLEKTLLVSTAYTLKAKR